MGFGVYIALPLVFFFLFCLAVAVCIFLRMKYGYFGRQRTVGHPQVVLAQTVGGTTVVRPQVMPYPHGPGQHHGMAVSPPSYQSVVQPMQPGYTQNNSHHTINHMGLAGPHPPAYPASIYSQSANEPPQGGPQMAEPYTYPVSQVAPNQVGMQQYGIQAPPPYDTISPNQQHQNDISGTIDTKNSIGDTERF